MSINVMYESSGGKGFNLPFPTGQSIPSSASMTHTHTLRHTHTHAHTHTHTHTHTHNCTKYLMYTL